MIFEYNCKNYCINCDWLQFSVLLFDDAPEFECPDGIRLEIVQGNNVFQHRCLVFDNVGRKMMTLLWHPYSSRLNSRLMTVQISNEFLYMCSIQRCFSLLQQIVPCVYNSMGRVDVCLDFEVDSTLLSTIYCLQDNTFYIQGKSEGSIFWHRVNSNVGGYMNEPHCLSFGSKCSEIKLKIYNKSRELGLLGGRKSAVVDGDNADDNDGHKPYIVDEWKVAGFNVKKVWRMEFSINGANQLRVDNKAINLEDVSSSHWQLNLFLKFFHTRAVIRRNEGKRNGHKNLDEIISLLDLPTSDVKVKWYEGSPLPFANCEAISVIRSLMSKLDSSAIMANEQVFTSYADTVCSLVASNRLDNWFLNRFAADPVTYFNNLYESVGTKVVRDFVTPNKLFD